MNPPTKASQTAQTATATIKICMNGELRYAMIYPPAPLTNRKRWTVSECEKLDEQGFLPKRFELLDGEICTKTGHCLPHATVIMTFFYWLTKIIDHERVLLHVLTTPAKSDAEYNLPEVDITVYRTSTRTMMENIPPLSEVVFAAEISDRTLDAETSTLADDLGYKADLYARAGVPEYWVLDINGRRLIVHRNPANGKYASITPFDEFAHAAPLFAPSQSILVGDLL